MHFVNAKGILSSRGGMNIYRGCSHGCIYCDSRSRCYAMEHAFEDIEVKQNAPELLEEELRSKRKRCMIGTGSMSDPYLPAEKELKLTRRCLEIIDRYAFGAALLTKSTLVLRDLELLKSINEKSKCVVQMTLTTADDELCRIVEPNVAVTSERVNALKVFAENGIPTVVWMCPILPYINDTEENILRLVEMCADAKVHGIINFGMGMTLRDGSREYYYRQLDRSFPGLKEKYIRSYGESYELASVNAGTLTAVFKEACGKGNIITDIKQCLDFLYDFPADNDQMSFF